MIERAILCEGLTGLIRVNALELGDGPKIISTQRRA